MPTWPAFRALASDYDGTLAENGDVKPEVLAALTELRTAGFVLVLVTGRELDDLLRVFPAVDLFDRVVAENGAVLYQPRPAPPTERLLASRIPPEFAAALTARGVAPLSCGRTIVATWEPHQHAVLDVIREQGLALDVIFNKGAVMVLPSGVDKATGLARALEELGVVADSVVAVGDAENDRAMFDVCGFSVAVANAIPSLKEVADLVTRGERGDGVIELCRWLVAGPGH